MRFADPHWLWIGAVAIVLAVVWRLRTGRAHAVDYSSVRLLQRLPRTWAQRLKPLLPGVVALGLAGVALALARPQIGKEETRIRTEGIAIEMAIDRSGSMAVLDCRLDGKQVDRFTAIKDVFTDFVSGGDGLPGRPDDLIGLVVFGGYADSKCPPTIDHGALLEILEDTDIPFHTRDPERGWPYLDVDPRAITRDDQAELATAIGDAVALAADRLAAVDAKSRVMIVLSDGKDTVAGQDPDASDPVDAARAAAALGIKIYTIGFGSRRRTYPRAEIDRFGRVFARENSNPGLVPDDETLREVATIGGGRFFRAESTEKLREVYAEIDRLEKTKTEGLTFVEYREVYTWPLLVGLGLLLAHALLAATRFRTLP